MNKVLLAGIVFIIGLVSGYCYLVMAGIISSYTVDISAGTIRSLKSYELLCLWPFVGGVFETVKLFFTAIPIFFIASYMEKYFFRQNSIMTNWSSSIGIAIFPGIFGTLPSLYDSDFFVAFIIIAIPILVNLFLMNKLLIPSKSEEPISNPHAGH